MRFSTWEITISTKEDVHINCARDVVAYLKKKCAYGFVVLERSSKWHLHAAVCFKQPMEKKHFEETIWAKVEKFHADSIKRYALKSTVQSDHDWRDNYLAKTTDRQILWDHYVKDEYDKCFPSKLEQAELQNAAEAKRPIAGDAKDPYYAKLESEWEEYTTEDSYESALKFLHYSMNVARTMRVIADPRRIQQTAWALHRYRTKAMEPTYAEKRYLVDQLGSACIYTPPKVFKFGEK